MKKNKEAEEIKEDIVEETENDEETVNPGDCIGHWLEGDEACEICEIQDSCKEMTKDINKEDDK